MGEERMARGLCGFVCFMKKEGAAKALNAMDGREWLGNKLRINWSKALPLPAKPLYGNLLASQQP